MWGIVLAAGVGARFGDRKQFASVRDLRAVDHAVARTSKVCTGVVLVLPDGFQWDGEPVAAIVVGGKTRLDSARRGLAAVPDSVEIVLIHDSAHFLAPVSLFEAVVVAISEPGVDAALPILEVKETVMRLKGGQAGEVIGRDGLVYVQTPQAFKTSFLRRAHESGEEASDDSVLAYRLGAAIRFVPGDPGNIHIATKDDLALANRLLQES